MHPEESIVFQGLIEYIWTSRVRLYHYVKSLQTVIQLGILLLWWQRHGRMVFFCSRSSQRVFGANTS